MFKYEIHKLLKGGREANSVLLEDMLTSDVFGLMSYLPYDLVLRPFLELVGLNNPKSAFSVPVGSPSDFSFWKSFEWPSRLPELGRQHIEPDVIMEWDDLVLVVEAKFISPTDAEELLREYLVGATEAGSQRHFFLLLIDRGLSTPSVSFPQGTNARMQVPDYIEKRIGELDLSPLFDSQEIHSSFLWFNWQGFYRLISTALKEDGGKSVNQTRMHPYRNILQDLLEILERKDLLPFERLVLEDLADAEIDLCSLGESGLMLRRSFSDLTDIFVDLDSLGQVGRLLADPLLPLSKLRLELPALTACL